MLAGIVTWAEIDLDAIALNVKAFRRHAGERVKVIAVVKANAYGHGVLPVARTALEAGVAMLAVHRAIEGVELRKAGIEAPILVMGYTPPDGAELVVSWRLTPSLMTVEFARALSVRAQAAGVQVPVHIKVDSGMSRYGLLPAEVNDFLRGIFPLKGLSFEGLFTHFASADALEPANTRQQLEGFNRVMPAWGRGGH